ncbi:MAG: hypothetical protein JNL19_06595 [Burkholderiales bacterium]|nr:hypothetical protein [Burkholderiales bacterium]
MSTSTSGSNPAAPTPVGTATPQQWPLDVLQTHLGSPDATVRARALAMVVLPGAPIDDCQQALARAAELSAGDDTVLPIVAVALGGITPKSLAREALVALTRLAGPTHSLPVRGFAAHSMFRLGVLPPEASAPVVELLLCEEERWRKVALLCITPFARPYAGAIIGAIAGVVVDRWTVEALQALALSTDGEAAAARTVESFIMARLNERSSVSVLIASYVALTAIGRGDGAIRALVTVATTAGNGADRLAALGALCQLGPRAVAAADGLGQALAATQDPESEEALCRALVQIKAPPDAVRFQHSAARIANGPDRSAAAHCMLLCLHPSSSSSAAAIIASKFETATDALRPVLASTFKVLSGRELPSVHAPSANA